ncbi:Coiled-coil domain-containing protein 39 [Chamberlinius hualienensis]
MAFVQEDVGAENQILRTRKQLKMTMTNSNRGMEEEINLKLKDIATLRAQVDGENERISSLMVHLNNLFEQLNESQKLCNAKMVEVQTELSWQKSIKTEDSRLRQENDKLQNQMEKLRERQLNQQTNITNLEKKSDHLRKQFQDNHHHIFNWIEEAIITEQTDSQLQYYIQEDSSKIKKLNLQIESLTAEELKRQQTLNDAIIKLKTAQMEYEKTSALFKSSHQECQKCIQQWEMTVKQIQIRDEEIETNISRLIESKEELCEIENARKNLDEKIERYHENNEHIQRQINKAEREISKLLTELQESETKRYNCQIELDSLKTSKVDLEKKLVKIKSEIDFQDKILNTETLRLKRINGERLKLIDEMNDESGGNKSAKYQQQTLEFWLAHETKYRDSIINELEIRHKDLAISRNDMADIKDEEKLKQSELKKLKSVNIENQKHLSKLELELEDQNKIISHKNKEIDRLQSKFNSSVDVSCPTDTKHRLQQIKEAIAAKSIASQTLKQDIAQQQNYICWQDKELKKYQRSKELFQEKLNDIDIEHDVMKKELNNLQSTKQKLTVQEMLLQLNIRHWSKLRSDKLVSLTEVEQRIDETEQMVNKRQLIVKQKQDEIEREIRLEETNKKRLNTQLNELNGKIDILKKRYEIELMPLHTWKNTNLQVEHFFIKVEEDKNNLKLENSKLRGKLEKTTQDMITYQNTLQTLHEKNESLWKTIYRAPADESLVQEIITLESGLNELIECVNTKKKNLIKDKEIVEHRTYIMNQIDDQINEMQLISDDKQHQLMEISSTIDEQQTKQNRARQLISKIQKNLNGNLYQNDVSLKVLQKYNKEINQSINEVLYEHPQIIPIIESLLKKYQFQLTSKPNRYSGYKSTAKLPLGLVNRLESRRPSTDESRRSTGSSSKSTSSLPSVVKIEFNNTVKNKSAGDSKDERKPRSSKK